MNHRRAEIVNSLYELLKNLTEPTETSGFPIQVQLVQKRWIEWTDLKAQNAIPALLLMPGRDGRKPDADEVGFIREQYPINLISVLEETDTSKPIIDQSSDMHYSIETLINGSRDLGIDVVSDNILDTRIIEFGGTEESLYPFLLTKFRLIIEHTYHFTESV